MSNRLPNDEWLHLAKRTAVGQQRRARHRSEGRENLVVGNTADRWWAYCQSCRSGGIEMKTHVMHASTAPALSKELSLPADARSVVTLHAHERDALTLQLAKKGMDWMYFGAASLDWSASRHRLLVHTPSGVMGRDTTERSDQKWLTYNRQHFLFPIDQHPDVLLVEDTYSYYKVRYACNLYGLAASVICTLGTSIHDSLFIYLLRNAKRVWSFYDGDVAGYNGEVRNAKRLRAAGLAGGYPGEPVAGLYQHACAPSGMDPKDMDLRDIFAHVAALLAI